jgi:hypothetical protein
MTLSEEDEGLVAYIPKTCPISDRQIKKQVGGVKKVVRQ